MRFWPTLALKRNRLHYERFACVKNLQLILEIRMYVCKYTCLFACEYAHTDAICIWGTEEHFTLYLCCFNMFLQKKQQKTKNIFSVKLSEKDKNPQMLKVRFVGSVRKQNLNGK